MASGDDQGRNIPPQPPGFGDRLEDREVAQGLARCAGDLARDSKSPLGIDERAFLLAPAGGGQHEIRPLGGFGRRIHVLHDEKFQPVAQRLHAAMVGQSGLNYARPDKNYSVPTYGSEELSGLEVMCIMFAAFQRVAPRHDIGIELHEPYIKALALHEGKKRNTG